MIPIMTLTNYYSELEVIKLELKKLNHGDLDFTAHREHCGWTSSTSGKGNCEEQKHRLKKFPVNHKGVFNSDAKCHKARGKASVFVPQNGVDDYMINYRHQKQIGRRRIGPEDSQSQA
ncbi:hypothetical protein TcWFU_003592 [Taenia crassiceps]|uniref:Uncharacterized protein n=1 Tax=Taenia crassiceps TaxID=6207 RepID=A0ABR4Q541_9CEST